LNHLQKCSLRCAFLPYFKSQRIRFARHVRDSQKRWGWDLNRTQTVGLAPLGRYDW